MPFGRGWFSRSWGRGGGWGRGNPYPFCRNFPWLPRWWWATPYAGRYSMTIPYMGYALPYYSRYGAYSPMSMPY